MLYYPDRVSLKGRDVFYNFRAEGKKKVARFVRPTLTWDVFA